MAENSGPQMHHPQAYQRLHTRPSASPPNANGLLPPHYRQHTPQPHPGSRPTSRNHNPISRPNSTLGHAPHPPNGYTYMNAPPHNGSIMQAPHPGQYPSQHHPQSQHYPGYPQPMHYLQPDQARNAMPQYSQPPPSERLAPQATMKVERQSASPPQVHETPRSQNDHLQPQPVRAMAPRSKSIFTPIDAGSSLADSWRVATSRDEAKLQETAPTKSESPDTRSKSNPRNAATAGRPQFAAPERTLSVNSASGGSRRPRLNLQIPSEQSEDETGQTGASSPQQSGDTGTSTTQNKSSEPQSTSHSGVILPPPSPSTLLSASATGPPNPFARPLPPNATTTNNNNSTFSSGNNIETPISALPSRFLDGGMLPSPSAFYPEWTGFSRSGGGDGNMLPSPLTFQTPTQGTGSGFGGASKDIAPGTENESQDRKRKTPERDLTAGAADKRAGKKVKSDS